MLGGNDRCGIQRQLVAIHVLRLVCCKQAGGLGRIAPVFKHLDGIALRNGFIVDSVYLHRQGLAGGLPILVGKGYADLERSIVVCIRKYLVAARGGDLVVVAVAHRQGEIVGIDVVRIGHPEIIEGNLPLGILVNHDRALLGDHCRVVDRNHLHGHRERLADGLAIAHRKLYRQVTVIVIGGMDGIPLPPIEFAALDDHSKLSGRIVGILDDQMVRSDGDGGILIGGDVSLLLYPRRIIDPLNIYADILRLAIIYPVVGDIGEEIAAAQDALHFAGLRGLLSVMDIGESTIRVEDKAVLRRVEGALPLHQPRRQLAPIAILVIAQHPLFKADNLEGIALFYLKKIISAARRYVAAHTLVHPPAGGEHDGADRGQASDAEA